MLSITNVVFMEKLIGLAGGLLLVFGISHFYGAEGYGVFVYVQVISTLVYIIGCWGGSNFILNNYDESPSVLFDSSLIKIILTGTLSIFSYMYFFLTELDSLDVLLVMLISSNLQFYDFIESSLISINKLRQIVRWKILVNIIFVVAKFVAIVTKVELIEIAMLLLVENFICSCLFYFILTRYDSRRHVVLSLEQVFRALKEGGALFFAGIGVLLYTRVDFLIIEKFLGMALLGQYALPIRIIEAVALYGAAFSSSNFYKLKDLKKNESSEWWISLEGFYRELFLKSIFIYVASLVVFSLIWWFFFRDEYPESIVVYGVIGGLLPFMSFRVFTGKSLIVENLLGSLFKRSMTGLVIKLLMGTVLVQFYGLYGVLVSAAFSYLYVGLIGDFFDKKTKGHFYSKVSAMKRFYKCTK